MKLIREINEEVSFITENNGVTNETDYYIEGIFMQADVKNRNGRIYPKGIMESEVSRYTNEFVIRKRAIGELGHPSGPGINEDRVSHLITDLSFDNNNVIGKAKILNTPNGKIVKELMKEGVLLGVSSRGVGSVANGKVQENFRLATVDIVSDPSGPDCFVNGIMENVDWIYDERNGWQAQQMAEDIQKEVRKGKVLTESEKISAFRKFLETL